MQAWHHRQAGCTVEGSSVGHWWASSKRDSASCPFLRLHIPPATLRRREAPAAAPGRYFRRPDAIAALVAGPLSTASGLDFFRFWFASSGYVTLTLVARPDERG